MKKNVFIYVALGLLASCTSEKPAPIGLDASPVVAQRMVTPLGDTLVVANMDLMIDTIDFPMSLLFSDFEIVKLEDKDEALIDQAYKFAFTPKHLCLFSFDNGLKMFDNHGRFITDISGRGQGPYEYQIGVNDILIDEDDESLYLSSVFLNYLMVFDLKGNPLRKVPLAKGSSNGDILFNIDKKKDYLYISKIAYKKDDTILWVQDFEGNMIQQLQAGHLAPNTTRFRLGELMNTTALDYSAGYWWDDDRIDTLYHYEMPANRLKPVFTANLTSIPTYHLYIELPCHYLIQMGDYGGVLTNYRHILIDKETLKGSYVRFNLDMLGNIGLQDWMYFVRGNYFKEFHPYELIEQWQGSDEFSELPPNMAKFMRYLQTHDTEDMNNVVLIGKLKQSKDEEFVLHDMNY